MDLYPLLLALAIAAVALAWLLLLVARRGPATLLGSQLAAVTAIAFDFASLVAHFTLDHRPGTSGAITFGQFLAEHQAFSVVAVGSLLAVGLATRASNHARRVA